MSWLKNLYQTYENCKKKDSVEANEREMPLLPICHTTQKAQIEITLDDNGFFRRAGIVPKEESRTIIPCTEKSAGRTSGEAAHPLCDKLQYIADDYLKFGGDKDSYFDSYNNQLRNWVKHGAPKSVQLILEYIERRKIIFDLVSNNILFVDKMNKLLMQRPDKKEKNSSLDIFDLLPGGYDPKTHKPKAWQADAFIRWRVEIPSKLEASVWKDLEIIQNWIDFYSSTKRNKMLCYVTGEAKLSADQHPAKIRNDGDKAKLIASGKSRKANGEITIDDGCGFTFLGRFTYPDQVAVVGFDITQKAHFALRWLISRQGFVKGDLAIVAWALSGAPVPQPTDDPITLLFGDTPSDEDPQSYTAQETAVQLKNRIAGYGRKMDVREKVTVMALDSATKGRLSIIYYNELSGPDFLKRIETWHTTCAWLHRYREVQDRESGKKRIVPFIGAPAPTDIAEAAYGIRVDDKLRKATISRLLPCIVDGLPIPRDLVESTIRRASNRAGLNNWDWEKTLSIACALFKKYKERKESFDMPLDETRNSRDYLYGRLLAIADVLEERALYKNEQKRATNAARYMQQFSQSPFRTWKQIHDSLAPSILRLGGAHYYKNLIAEVESLFDPADFISNKALTGEYLLGYYCQRQKLFEKNDKSASEKIESTEEK